MPKTIYIASRLTNYQVAIKVSETFQKANVDTADSWMHQYDPKKPEPRDAAIKVL